MPPRPRVAVVHWDPLDLPDKVRAVEESGGDVVASEAEDGGRLVAHLAALKPDVLAVWATRKPSHGRITAAAARSTAWGRGVHILFLHDEPLPAATLASLKAAVPGALFLEPRQLRLWLGKIAALANKS